MDPAEPAVFTTARLRLLDFLKDRKVVRTPARQSLLFTEARELYEQRLANNAAVKARSKEYRLLCLARFKSTWPGIDARRVNELTSDECREWAGKLAISGHYFNNTISTLRQILDVALQEHKRLRLAALREPGGGDHSYSR